MEKTGELRPGKTPCLRCGRPSETSYRGEAYCMTHYLQAVDPKSIALTKQSFAEMVAPVRGPAEEPAVLYRRPSS